MKKILAIILWIISVILLWLATFLYPSIALLIPFPEKYLLNTFYTILALGIIYIIFKVIIEEAVVKRIKETKTKYSFKKIVSILYILAFLVVLTTIWIEQPQTLFVAYGVVGAGIAIALQDLFKSLAGGIIIYVNRLYSVGDRIEIQKIVGDVIDIHILYTTILEIQGWVEGDQATGRLAIVPNSFVLSNTIYNFTKDHNFIWDEITIPITYDSDWKEAYNKILDIVKDITKQIAEQAAEEIERLEEIYYMGKRVVDPSIFLKLTDNWITFSIRYVTDARKRRSLRHKLSQAILEEIQKSKNIKIASVTLDIVGFPKQVLSPP
ncbi:MAG: mechanosensitive ion channel family protein [Promethearchaeota archaeon]